VTAQTGAFWFASLPIGIYRVTFDLPGFKKLVLEQVSVTVGATTDLQPKLDLSKVQETVTVSATVSPRTGLVSHVSPILAAACAPARLIFS
jgi:hypothetical protein